MDENKLHMNQFAYISRGSIINETALLEMHMNQIIAEYFCNNNDKQIELINVILGTEKISFFNLKETLRYVIKEKYPDYDKENKGWNGDIEKIMRERNIFAHHALDIRDESIIEFGDNGKIGLAKYKNEQIILKYDIRQVRELIQLISRYIGEFRQLLGLKS